MNQKNQFKYKLEDINFKGPIKAGSGINKF